MLVADTAVPAWHDAYRELPFVFAGSALAAGGGVGLLAGLTGRDVAPARIVAVAGAVAGAGRHRRRWNGGSGSRATAYRTGRAGTVLKAARAGTLLGGIGALAVGVPARPAGPAARRCVGGLLLNAASAATRFGIFEAGMASARDPAYTVVPQRARLDAV